MPINLAVTIKIPPEAVIPLLLVCVGIIILIAFGTALASWRAKNPQTAALVGTVVAGLLTAYALYALVTIVPATYIDRGAPGQRTLGFLDGPIAGIAALFGTIFWRYGGKRWIALGAGLAFGLVLFAKPFLLPLHSYSEYSGEVHTRAWDFMDPEHLSFHGPGVAVMITALVAGLKKPAA
jgi:hypothetical protein